MWILVEETKCTCFVCLFVFADFCELVGGSCRQWFNFHEEFFFLFLLPPIILYPQKTEGKHFVVLLLACLLIHVSLVLFLFLTLPGQGWFWWFLDNWRFHRVWIQPSSGMFIFPGWCCGFLCVSFFFWVCSVAQNLNTAIISVLANDFQFGMLCSWQSASFLLFRNHSFPTLVQFASLHSWELLSHQFSLES